MLVALFLDLSKAYDTLYFDILLLTKLNEYKLSHNALDIIISNLLNRFQLEKYLKTLNQIRLK